MLISAVLLIGTFMFLANKSQAADVSPTIITVDNSDNVGVGTAITINSLGQEVIAFHDFTNSALKVAICDTQDCSSPIIKTV